MRRLSLLLGLGLLTGCASGHPGKYVVFFTENSTSSTRQPDRYHAGRPACGVQPCQRAG